MRLFDTPGADTSYDSYLNPPDEREATHQDHVEEGQMGENYKILQCCTEAIDDLISVGEWCSKNPSEHQDLYLDGEIKEIKLEDGSTHKRFFQTKPVKCLECQEGL